MDYDDCIDDIGVFCGIVCIQPLDDGTEGQQRRLLPRKQEVTLVYGGIRNGGCIHIGGDLRVGAGNGDEDGHDIPSDVPRIHPRIFRRGIPAAARILPA